MCVCSSFYAILMHANKVRSLPRSFTYVIDKDFGVDIDMNEAFVKSLCN